MLKVVTMEVNVVVTVDVMTVDVVVVVVTVVVVAVGSSGVVLEIYFL